MGAQVFCPTGNSRIKKVAESLRKLYVHLVVDETSSDKLKSVKSAEI